MIRVGVIGVGFGGKVHIPAFRRSGRCEVAALCASTEERAKEAAQRHGVDKFFGDWNELIRQPYIDAVSIATPPSLQQKIALAALENRKAVFCEKPLALSKAEAFQMAEKARSASVANMVDFEFPEIPVWQKAKRVLEEGGIGRLRHVAVSWNIETYANKMGIDSWKTRTAEGGGALNAFVSHAFYYLEWMLGKIKRMSAQLSRYKDAPGTGDTLAVLCLEFQSGVPAVLSVSTHALFGNGHRLEFYGDKGTLALDNPTPDYIKGFRLLTAHRGSKSLEEIKVGDKAKDSVEDGRILAVSSLIDRFAAWIETGSPDMPSFKEGLRVQNLLDLARQSHETSAWVNCSSENSFS